MKTFWKNHQFFLAVTSSLILVALASYLFIIPLVKRVIAQSDEIQKEIINDEIYRTGLEKIPQVEKEYNDFAEKKYAVEVILNSDDEVGFIEKLEGLARETGNDIELKAGNIHYREDDPRADSKEKAALAKKKEEDKTMEEKLSYGQYFSMRINLKGDYSGLVNFINKLENSNYYINITSLSLKKEKESELKNSPLSSGTDENSQSSGKEIISSSINAIIYTKD